MKNKKDMEKGEGARGEGRRKQKTTKRL